MAIYRGTNGSDRLSADENPSGIVEMYGLRGNDLLEGSFGFANYIYGGDGNDTLVGAGAYGNHFFGGDGNDELHLFFNGEDSVNEAFGGRGDDFLEVRLGTGDGVVLLDGGLGADTLSGHDGRDVYRVNSIHDEIIETFVPEFDNIPNPRDEVRASRDWALTKRLEDLTLVGTKDINGTGNSESNYLSGNRGNNALDGGRGQDTLDGGSGADTLTGGKGNDRYMVSDASATVIEKADEGTDTVFASVSFRMGRNVERIELTDDAISTTGNKLDNRVTGNELDNSLKGARGDDRIDGRDGDDRISGDEGADQLTGGKGKDKFIFDSASESEAGSTRDLISDLRSNDQIDLSGIGPRGGDFFTFVTGDTFSGSKGDLIFSGESLLGDTNGDGVADFEIRLVGVTHFDADSLIL